MKPRITFTAALLAGTFLTGSAWAATINVNSGGSIQEAINKSSAGDTILVAPGTYAPFEINRDGITVKSAEPGGAHIKATGSRQPAIASYGQNNIAILDFQLTSENGDGVKIGGSASKDAKNIQFSGNTVNTAALDGLKFFQLDGLTLTSNTVKQAGTSRNGNGDGGIDFVGVDNSTVQDNKVEKTFGHACLMLKGGSDSNTITGNAFLGCERDGITVGGFTDANLMDSSDGGKEAHNNKITGNQIEAGSKKCAFYYHKASNNTVSGNQTSGGHGGCSNAGGGGNFQLANVGSGSSSSPNQLQTNLGGLANNATDTDETFWQAVESGEAGALRRFNDLVSGGILVRQGNQIINRATGQVTTQVTDAINSAYNSVFVPVETTVSSLGNAVVCGVGGSWVAAVIGINVCAAKQLSVQGRQLEEQQRMNAGIDSNVTGSSSITSNGVVDTFRLTKDSDLGEHYQSGASAPMTAQESLAYHRELRESTDSARRNALETAAANAAAEKEYAKMADEALALSQEAQGPTSAQQAQTQMDRAREGAAASRISTQLAFEHAKLMDEEQQRASERLGEQRRARLYRNEGLSDTSAEPFKLFQ